MMRWLNRTAEDKYVRLNVTVKMLIADIIYMAIKDCTLFSHGNDFSLFIMTGVISIFLPSYITLFCSSLLQGVIFLHCFCDYEWKDYFCFSNFHTISFVQGRSFFFGIIWQVRCSSNNKNKKYLLYLLICFHVGLFSIFSVPNLFLIWNRRKILL